MRNVTNQSNSERNLHMRKSKSLSLSCVAAVLGCLAMSPPASAQDRTEEVVHATHNTNVTVPLYKSRVVVLPGAVKRVSIGNPVKGLLIGTVIGIGIAVAVWLIDRAKAAR